MYVPIIGALLAIHFLAGGSPDGRRQGDDGLHELNLLIASSGLKNVAIISYLPQGNDRKFECLLKRLTVWYSYKHLCIRTKCSIVKARPLCQLQSSHTMEQDAVQQKTTPKKTENFRCT